MSTTQAPGGPLDAVSARRRDGTPVALERAAVAALGDRLDGRVVVAGDPPPHWGNRPRPTED